MNAEDEILLLTYSPVLHAITIQQIVRVLEMTVTTINGESCFLRDIRVDEKEHKIYGKGKKIETYGEYK